MTLLNEFDAVFLNKINQQNHFNEVFGHILGSRAFSFPGGGIIASFPYLEGWNPVNIYEITIDSSLIDADLTHFPLSIVLGGSESEIFDEFVKLFDTFAGVDGDSVNSEKWNTYYDDVNSGNSSGVVTIQDNKLNIAIPATSSTGSFPVIISQDTVSGDFDVQVDFDLTAGSPDSNWAQILAVGSVNDDVMNDAKVAYTAIFAAPNGHYRSATYNVAATTVASSDWSGKFRIVRVDSTLVTYYWNGTSWVSIVTDSSYGTGDVYIKMAGRTWAARAFECNFDNLKVCIPDVTVWKKIAITKADGSQLYAEKEQWDSSAQKALLHVSKDDFVISSTEDTKLYLYYDSTHADNDSYVGEAGDTVSKNVWDSGFVAVYNLADEVAGVADEVVDSKNDYHMVGASSYPVRESTDLGIAQDFSTDRIQSSSGYDVSSGTELTIETFFNTDVINLQYQTICGNSDGTDGSYQSFFAVYYDQLKFVMCSGGTPPDVTIVAETDYYTAIAIETGEADGASFFLDEDLIGSVAAPSNFSDHYGSIWRIGWRGTSYVRSFDGLVYCVRVSNVKRSTAWLKAASYAMHNSLLTLALKG